MTIKQMKSILATNKFDNYECNFKIKSKGPQVPEWFKDFATTILNRLDKIDEFIVEQRELNKFVLDQFKKHGWVK